MDEDLLKQIRDDYRHFLDYWREVRLAAEVSMRYASGDAWPPQARKEREGQDTPRPCVSPDELSQYVRQATNNLRQNKRAIKIVPKGEGATDKQAQHRASVIRGVEYKSNAQAAYSTAYEQCAWGGFGFFRIVLVHSDREGFDVEPRIVRIPNQFSVLLDPYANEADFSDGEKLFLFRTLSRAKFQDLFGEDAKSLSMGADELMNIAPDWIKGENFVVAEYWWAKRKKAKRYKMRTPEGGVDVNEEEKSKFKNPEIMAERSVDDIEVIQHITNGIEIKEKILWPGSWIPIIPVLGEEIYTSDGGQSKRKFMSLTKRAEEAQTQLAYIASQEQEEFGMAPRAVFMAYKGQIPKGDEDIWANINRIARAYVEVEAMTDAGGSQILPPPTRPQFTPNAQAYEVARESWRRSIQASVGFTPLPSSAQRQNEKSGIALERIQTQEAVGSYHITDNLDRALVNCGRQLNQLITLTMTAPRHVGVMMPDDTHGLIAVGHSQHKDHELMQGENVLFTDQGEFDVTITTGPSYQSQREEASSFVDTLIANLQALPIPPPIAQKILALAIKLKNIGPIGDEINKLLDPEQGDPQQQMQQVMAKAAQQQQLMTEMQAELQKLQMEKQGKVVENQFKLEIEKMRHSLEIAKLDNARAIAEIQTKAQIESERSRQLHEVDMELHGAAHEVAMQKDQQAADAQAAEAAAQTASTQSAQDADQAQVSPAGA